MFVSRGASLIQSLASKGQAHVVGRKFDKVWSPSPDSYYVSDMTPRIYLSIEFHQALSRYFIALFRLQILSSRAPWQHQVPRSELVQTQVEDVNS
jgi:hypothetical protein